MADAWDTAQVDRFRDERRQPFLHLVGLRLPRLPRCRALWYTCQRILIGGHL